MASNDASPWPTVTFIGVLCGITFGLVLYSILRKERGEGLAQQTSLPIGDFDLGLSGLGGGVPLPSATAAKALPQVNMGKPRPSAARTMTISDSKPTMVLRAVGGDWRVSVRALSPHSAFASFIVGQDEDSSIVVPTGSAQELWLPKGQYLYAQGSQAGVTVSVSGGRS